MCYPLLTTIVFALFALERLGGLTAHRWEELVHPLGQRTRVGTIGNDGKVGLCVGAVCVLFNGASAQVLVQGNRGCRVEWDSETAVESKSIGRVAGQLLDIAEERLLGQLDGLFNLLVVDMVLDNQSCVLT